MTERVVGLLGVGVVPLADRAVFADDLGLTRGDGCFEATRVVTDADGAHRVDHMAAHLDRFDASSHGLNLPPVDRAGWGELIEKVLAAWTRPGEAMLRLMLSRGRESEHGPITGLATLTPMSAEVLRQRADGIAVVTLNRGFASDAFTDAPWLLGGVKTLSYGVNVAALREAARRGADDVLFLSTDGYALEAPTATVVWLADDTLRSTPLGATGVLASITQRALFDAATEAGLSTEFALGRPAQLRVADGVWLVSSGRGVAEVHTLDGHPLNLDPDLTERLRTLAGF